MPELFSSESLSVDSRIVLQDLFERGNVSSNDVAQLLKTDWNFVGEGGRMAVAALENDPDKLVAVSYKESSPEEAKAVYYNHQILCTLFPDNFPRIYAAYGRLNGKGLSLNFRERVYGETFSKAGVQKMLNKVDRGLKDGEDRSMARVIDVLRQLEIPFYFDNNERNYMKGSGGQEVYVDTFNFRGWTEEMKTKVLVYMKHHSYDEKDIRIVENGVKRLLLLTR